MTDQRRLIEKDTTSGAHVRDEDLASYIDSELDPVARRAIEGHLAECDDCRAVLVASERTLQARGSRASTLRWTVAAVAGLAAVLVLAVPRLRSPEAVPSSNGVSQRGPLVGESLPHITLQAPNEGTLVRPDTLVFRWGNAGKGITYQITVSDVRGAIVWTAATRDSTIALPASAAGRLMADSAYYWRIDAMLPDLRSTTTEPQVFTVAKR